HGAIEIAGLLKIVYTKSYVCDACQVCGLSVYSEVGTADQSCGYQTGNNAVAEKCFQLHRSGDNWERQPTLVSHPLTSHCNFRFCEVIVHNFPVVTGSRFSAMMPTEMRASTASR